MCYGKKAFDCREWHQNPLLNYGNFNGVPQAFKAWPDKFSFSKTTHKFIAHEILDTSAINTSVYNNNYPKKLEEFLGLDFIWFICIC